MSLLGSGRATNPRAAALLSDPALSSSVNCDRGETGEVSAWHSGGVQLVAQGVGHSVRVRRGLLKPILADIHATFAAGTLTALMGPSGAGKTTLLHVLRTGRCTAGSVLVNGGAFTKHTRRL